MVLKVRKRFYCRNWQGKANSLVGALLSSGMASVSHSGVADFMFSDFDQTGNLQQYQRGKARNKRLLWFLYPHSARPVLMWDTTHFSPKRDVVMNFVVNDYHQDILRLANYPYAMCNTGWHLTEIKPFSPRKEIRKVVFAPIHPNANGWLSEMDKDINRRTHTALVDLSQKMGFHLTVRYLRGIEANGFSFADGVTYVNALPDGSMKEALNSDIVVSHQTYAFMAVALGIPTVMIDEAALPRCGNSDDTFKLVRNWRKYKDLVMYPLDLLDCNDPAETLEKAAEGSWEVEDWKRRLIGTPFNPKDFVTQVVSLLG